MVIFKARYHPAVEKEQYRHNIGHFYTGVFLNIPRPLGVIPLHSSGLMAQ